jgi:hypothetical protein
VTEDRLLWIRHNRKQFNQSQDRAKNLTGKRFFVDRITALRARERKQRDDERRYREYIVRTIILLAFA